MGRTTAYDRQALAELLRLQDGVIDRAQATRCAMTESALRHRIRPDGPWQVLLPGVYLAHTGTMTIRQRDMAAFLYADRRKGGAVAISGAAALEYHGMPSGGLRPVGQARASGRAGWSGGVSRPGPSGPAEFVDVLVRPPGLRRDTRFVRLHVTTANLTALAMDGPLRYAPPGRAVLDAARQLHDLAEIRALVAACVQRGKASLWQLAQEVARGPVPGSAALRQALAEVAEGVRSTTEGDLLSLIKRGRLPVPLLNPRLYIGGEFLAMPDAYWPEFGVAAEVDSREWHLSPGDWEQTMARHARMSARGIIVLHFPPSRIRKAGREVVAEIRGALASATRHEIPGLRVASSASSGIVVGR